MSLPPTSPWRLLIGCAAHVRWRLAGAAALGAAAGGSGVALAATSGWLIARAAQHPPVLTLMVAAVMVRAFGIGRGVLRYAERLVSHDAALRVTAGLRVRVFEALIPRAPVDLAGERSGDLLTRMSSDVDAVQDLYVRALLPAAGAVAIGCAAVGFTAWLLPAAALTLLLALVLGGVGVPCAVVAADRRAARHSAQARGKLAAAVVDLLDGSAELLAFNATELALERVEAADAELAALERRSALGVAFGTVLSTAAAGLALWSALAIGIPAVRSGALAGVMLAVVVLLAWATPDVVADLPAVGQYVARARAAARRIRELTAARPSVAEPAQPLASPRGAAVITLHGVVAGYSRQQPVLRGVDLELRAGSRVVVVGASGAGKSTLAAVLLRFLDIEQGSLTMDGVDVRRYCGDDIRRVIGCCEQLPHLFDTTIRANLVIGRPDATDEELATVLLRVGLGPWLDSLPAGLATEVGEHGAAVSEGQLRRLALARVLLGDFPVLLLDEPTEGLDDAAASALVRDVFRATPDRAVLLITHELTWTDDADDVFELDDGRLRRQAAVQLSLSSAG
jgi:thiol reductant ABC exporter CydC subunit